LRERVAEQTVLLEQLRERIRELEARREPTPPLGGALSRSKHVAR